MAAAGQGGMVLRSAGDRILQTLAYEAGGLLIATPLYALIAGQAAQNSMLLIAAVALACMAWAPIHNTLFDIIDFKLTGRVASERPHRLRMLHALSHETSSIIITCPIIMAMGHHSFFEALVVDAGLTALYTAYAYVFHIGYDRLRPIARPGLQAVAAARCASIPPSTEKFGVHIMIDGYGAPYDVLDNEYYLRKLLNDLPRMIGMHAIAAPQLSRVGPMNRKDPGGLSGFVMIAESHISFHTFPARGFVTMDLYTCQGDIDRDNAVTLLKHAFRLSDADVFIQDRGLRYPSQDVTPADDMALSA
jgi:S-adenosylmethionine decarboxylase